MAQQYLKLRRTRVRIRRMFRFNTQKGDARLPELSAKGDDVAHSREFRRLQQTN
jgi:hypothetical protein